MEIRTKKYQGYTALLEATMMTTLIWFIWFSCVLKFLSLVTNSYPAEWNRFKLCSFASID